MHIYIYDFTCVPRSFMIFHILNVNKKGFGRRKPPLRSGKASRGLQVEASNVFISTPPKTKTKSTRLHWTSLECTRIHGIALNLINSIDSQWN